LDLYDPEWRKQKPEEKCSDEPKINFVTPTQQVVEQAEALMKLQTKGIKRRKGAKSVTSSKKAKGKASLKKQSRTQKARQSDNLD